VSRHEDAAADEGAHGRTAGPAGLLEKLVAAVRPEFRAQVLVFDPRDPVFGAAPCAVVACQRPARSNQLCWGHRQRWQANGKPDLAGYVASTTPEWVGHSPLPGCQVAGCNYPQTGHGMCQVHLQRWTRAGRPDLASWRRAQDPSPPSRLPPTCRVSYCDLWAMRTSVFCRTHHKSWRLAGRPDEQEFIAARDDAGPGYEHIDLQCLPGQLGLEMRYVLQCRAAEGTARIFPAQVQRIVRDLAAIGVSSLLDRPEEYWAHFDPRPDRTRGGWHAFALDAHHRIEQLAFGSGWEVEYPRDRWRLRNLGIDHQQVATLDFGKITQPWLRELAKRFIRWRLTSGLSPSDAANGVRAIRRLSAFLAAQALDSLAQVDRPLLERYLADLHAELGGYGSQIRHLSALNVFFRAIRQHHWDDTLPGDAFFFPQDYPKPDQKLPRALAEQVMAQIEQPENLDRWDSPRYRLVTLILINCGLRISDALKLPADCIITDNDGAPYLRYYNHKMRREALVPISAELRAQIAEQQRRTLERWPAGAPLLIPRLNKNLDGQKPMRSGTYREALHQWLQRCDVRDEHGQPVHLTPHQWRHTLGTRLINRDVPQHVVQKILDHDSPIMTAHYARLSDQTVRRHWDQARKVNIHGEQVTLDPAGPLAEAAWAKQRIGRATQALPNGYCGLPLIKTCAHANACLTCPLFVTTTEFLPQHREQHQHTLRIISAAEANGQTRMAEMNQQVADNLHRIITALQAGDDPQEGTAHAS
jgi:integrase